MKFSLKSQEYIELNKLLQILSWADSGGEAKQIITEELVSVNGTIELRKRCKIRAGSVVAFNGETCKVVE